MDKENANLTDCELKIMQLIWSNEGTELTASSIAEVFNEYMGWSKNTTYTYLTRMSEKGFIARIKKPLVCIPLKTRDEIARLKSEDLLRNFYNESVVDFVSEYVTKESITKNSLQLLIRRLQAKEKELFKEDEF